MPAKLQLTGRRFDMLLVLADAGTERGATQWFCVCDCGNTAVVAGSSLRSGNTGSCGCRSLRAGLAGEANPAFRHGHAKRARTTSAYYKWQHMIGRCTNPANKDWHNYGARGITVCDRWRTGDGARSGFECWLHDMGAMPKKGMTIGRKDNNAGYAPDNCRWEDAHMQANNRRTSVLLTYKGRTQTVAQWAREMGIGPKTIAYRLRQGASIGEALTKIPNHGIELESKS